MKKEVKERWITDLRSGKYKQGVGSLRSADKYCCLGVLCEQAAEVGVGKWEKLNPLGRYAFVTPEDQSQAVLPSAVIEFAEIPPRILGDGSTAPNRRGTTPKGCLTDANDLGKSFEEIADLIERYM